MRLLSRETISMLWRDKLATELRVSKTGGKYPMEYVCDFKV